MSAELTSGLVRVLAPDGSIGTGFVVSDDGLIVTCSHVVQSESSQRANKPRPETVTVVFHVDGSSHSASVVSEWWRSCDAEDVAFLRLNAPLPTAAKPLKLGVAKISRGHEFLSHGYRLATQFAQGLDAEGRIQSLTTYRDWSVLQLLTNQIDHGMSGAPIFDTQTQRVVGMANFFWETTRHVDGWLAGAVPAEALKAICDALILHPPQAIEDYLAAVREYCANLPYLTLHDIRPPKTLDEVYVSLKVRPRPREREDKKKSENEQAQKREETLRLEREKLRLARLSIAKVMMQRNTPHVLILGEPGAGKSTLLRHMAERAWDAPKAIGLSEQYLPLLVSLRQLASTRGTLDDRLRAMLNDELPLPVSLPVGFLNEWTEQTGKHWLILLDALDEVPDSGRDRSMQWLRGQLSNLREHCVVVTSRPSSYEDDFDPNMFSHYSLLSFTPKQTNRFARKWFKNKSDAFLKELGRIRAGDLRGTPLLLTIAAKVFGEGGTLPERRSMLFDQFVTIWLNEAQQRDETQARGDLRDRLWDVAPFVLARLALTMTDQPEQVTEKNLSDAAANYLQEALALSDDEAESRGRRLVDVLARRSGVFTRRGDVYQFIHPTFREYLTALAVVRACHQDLACMREYVASHLGKTDWFEVILFILGICSDNNQDVTDLLRLVWQTKRSEASLFFAGLALTDHVKVTPNLSNKIIDALLGRVREMWENEDWPLAVLSNLHGYTHASKGLLAMARDETIYVWRRSEIVTALEELGRDDDLKMLGSDENVDIEIRQESARALERLGFTAESDQVWLMLSRTEAHQETARALERRGFKKESAPVWLTLARRGDNLIYQEAIAALGRLGYASDIFALAVDGHLPMSVRRSAAEELGQLGRTDDLLVLARDPLLSSEVRERVAEVLGELGLTEESAEMLATIAREDHTAVWINGRAIKALGQLGETDALLTLMRDARTDAKGRLNAAESLIELGYVGEAAVTLMALSRDEEISPRVRQNAIAALVRDARIRAEKRGNIVGVLDELGHANAIVTILLMTVHDMSTIARVRLDAIGAFAQLNRIDELLFLAYDESTDANVQREAAEALADLGQKEEAVAILLSLLHSDHTHVRVRIDAATALGQLGLADQPEATLLAIVVDMQLDDDVRVGAIESLAKIGGARVLPELDRAAQSDPDWNVHIAAREAADAIRVRLGNQSL